MSCWNVDELKQEVSLHDKDIDGIGIDQYTADDLSTKLRRTYIYTAFISFLFLTMLPAIYLYLKDYFHKVKAKKHGIGTTVPFCTGLLFIVVTIVCFGGSIPGRIITYLTLCQFRANVGFTKAQAMHRWDAVFYSLSLSYMFQALLVTVILFQRVYYVFSGSVYAIKPGELTLFCGVQCSFLAFVGWFAVSETSILSYKMKMQVIIYLAAAMNISMSLWMVNTFVWRLRRICEHHRENAASHSILRVIAKVSMLQWISLTSFIVTPILDMCWGSLTRVHASEDLFYWFFGIHISANIVMFVNFWCIMLSYKFMDALYRKLCGRCDTMYERCCTEAAQRKVELRRNTLEMIYSNTRDEKEEVGSRSPTSAS